MGLMVNRQFVPKHQADGNGNGNGNGDGGTYIVQTTVFALVPEYAQVLVRDEEGFQYALTRRTSGIELDALHEGQRVVCTVTRYRPRVLSAQAVA